MSQNLNKYLKILKSESNRLERTDINNKLDDSAKAKYLNKFIFVILSITITCLLSEGFSEVFISFVSSILAILVGLFITALIFSFDKFHEPVNDEFANARIKLWEKQAFNYAKKFAYVTSRTIVLSIYTLIIISISALFKNTMNLNVHKLTFITSNVGLKDVWTFVIAVFVIIQRFFVLYWLFRIVYNTLYIVSSMVQYMTTKLER